MKFKTIGAAFLVSVTLLLGCSEKKETESVAVVTFASGQVKIEPADPTSEIKSASVGYFLKQGDVVRTKKNSRVDFQLDEQIVVRANSNTVISIAKLLRASQSGAQDTTLNLELGTIYSKVKKLKSDSNYEISTPTTVAGVRGTEFVTEAQKDGSSEVAVSEGAVDVESSTGEKTTVQEGKKAQVKSDGKVEEKDLTESEKKRLVSLAKVKQLDSKQWSQIEGFMKKAKEGDKDGVKGLRNLKDLQQKFGSDGDAPTGLGKAKDKLKGLQKKMGSDSAGNMKEKKAQAKEKVKDLQNKKDKAKDKMKDAGDKLKEKSPF